MWSVAAASQELILSPPPKGGAQGACGAPSRRRLLALGTSLCPAPRCGDRAWLTWLHALSRALSVSRHQPAAMWEQTLKMMGPPFDRLAKEKYGYDAE